MDKVEASRIWKDIIDPELHLRLLDVRPKLKSYDATLIGVKARDAVIAKYETTDDVEVLKKAAFSVMANCKYVRGSRWAK